MLIRSFWLVVVVGGLGRAAGSWRGAANCLKTSGGGRYTTSATSVGSTGGGAGSFAVDFSQGASKVNSTKWMAAETRKDCR
jgi:hypothetical protein